MKRIHLFEFEDFEWLPKSIRTAVTNLIVVLHRLIGTSDVIAGLIKQARNKFDFSQIVDLGSGSGGAMLDVIKKINEKPDENPINLILTDLYPNPVFIKNIDQQNLKNVTYYKKPVDATNISDTLKGLKTMVNSFHHMSPKTAKKILKSAHDNQQPILIYEMGENFVPTVLWWLLLPLSLLILIVMVLFMTPFVRPLTWKQLLFTYIIPVIPIVYAWDGQASTMRTYTFKDIEQLTSGLNNNTYRWEMGKAKKENGKSLGYYLMGYSNKA